MRFFALFKKIIQKKLKKRVDDKSRCCILVIVKRQQPLGKTQIHTNQPWRQLLDGCVKREYWTVYKLGITCKELLESVIHKFFEKLNCIKQCQYHLTAMSSVSMAGHVSKLLTVYICTVLRPCGRWSIVTEFRRV